MTNLQIRKENKELIKDNKLKCRKCLEIQHVDQFEISNKKTGLRRKQCKNCRSVLNKAAYMKKVMFQEPEEEPIGPEHLKGLNIPFSFEDKDGAQSKTYIKHPFNDNMFELTWTLHKK